MATTTDIIHLLNGIAPFDIAESWDNSGLQVGNPNWTVKKIIIALDATLPLINQAVETGSALVLTHHPLLMSPEKSIDFSRLPGRIIDICAKNRISIVSVHTNLDKAVAGLNDYFLNKLGIEDSLGPLSREDADDPGIGRLAALPEKITLDRLASQVKSRLKLDYLRVSGDLSLPVKEIAVCTGSGGSLLPEFIKSNADVFVTGDVKYHDARKIEEISKGLIDVGHFGSEQIAIDLLYEKLTSALDAVDLKVELICYKEEKDPFTIV